MMVASTCHSLSSSNELQSGGSDFAGGRPCVQVPPSVPRDSAKPAQSETTIRAAAKRRLPEPGRSEKRMRNHLPEPQPSGVYPNQAEVKKGCAATVPVKWGTESMTWQVARVVLGANKLHLHINVQHV